MKLMTDRQTERQTKNRQTDKRRALHNLLGGCKCFLAKLLLISNIGWSINRTRHTDESKKYSVLTTSPYRFLLASASMMWLGLLTKQNKTKRAYTRQSTEI